MWYAVKHSNGNPEHDVWTISQDPNECGWETDGGYYGYGLTKEKAAYIVGVLNDHEAIKDRSSASDLQS